MRASKAQPLIPEQELVTTGGLKMLLLSALCTPSFWELNIILRPHRLKAYGAGNHLMLHYYPTFRSLLLFDVALTK